MDGRIFGSRVVCWSSLRSASFNIRPVAVLEVQSLWQAPYPYLSHIPLYLRLFSLSSPVSDQ